MKSLAETPVPSLVSVARSLSNLPPVWCKTIPNGGDICVRVEKFALRIFVMTLKLVPFVSLVSGGSADLTCLSSPSLKVLTSAVPS